MNIVNFLIAIIFILFSVIDIILYISTPLEIRAGHWWSYFPGSGFYVYMKYKRN